MTTIYLIRHAEAEGNLYRIAQGQGNSNLTDRGWRQVAALEERFRTVAIDAVYTSDLYRTCATATAIYRAHGLPLHRRRDLREIGVGSWEHRTWGDIYRREPEAMAHFLHAVHLWHTEGGEPPRQVTERMYTALQEIVARHPNETVAVFSHGYAIRLLLARLQGVSLEQVNETPLGENTAVSLLLATPEGLEVVYRDDTAHLQTEAFLRQERPKKRHHDLEPGLWFAPTDTASGAEYLSSLPLPAGQTAHRPERTLIGYLKDTPVGAVTMGDTPGHIALAYIDPACRSRGFGAQLIGQATQWGRKEGSQRLFVLPPAAQAAENFFLCYGFHPSTNPVAGTLEKNIGFDPEIAGEEKPTL